MNEEKLRHLFPALARRLDEEKLANIRECLRVGEEFRRQRAEELRWQTDPLNICKKLTWIRKNWRSRLADEIQVFSCWLDKIADRIRED